MNEAMSPRLWIYILDIFYIECYIECLVEKGLGVYCTASFQGFPLPKFSQIDLGAAHFLQ